MSFIKKLPKTSPGELFLWGVIVLSPLWAYAAHHWLGLGLVLTSKTAWLWAIMGAPLVEEVVFRYLLQDKLTKILLTQPKWGSTPTGVSHAANVLSSFAFAFAHPIEHALWFQLWWLLPSLVLGELWRRYQSLWVCVATHAWFNLCLWWVG